MLSNQNNLDYFRLLILVIFDDYDAIAENHRLACTVLDVDYFINAVIWITILLLGISSDSIINVVKSSYGKPIDFEITGGQVHAS